MLSNSIRSEKAENLKLLYKLAIYIDRVFWFSSYVYNYVIVESRIKVLQ